MCLCQCGPVKAHSFQYSQGDGMVLSVKTDRDISPPSVLAVCHSVLCALFFCSYCIVIVSCHRIVLPILCCIVFVLQCMQTHTHTHTETRTHARTHARTYARTHALTLALARAHARTHARTHTHTHTHSVIIIIDDRCRLIS